ncbi:hypothetical protein [Rhodanobacter panaciterrae]|uniref:hypothetical protein n=1 Tax=Rhodanobacter panaciterrae TaxID=490572 RepID=UPI00167A8D81|nr:hypothetical protein [Rhodanobacter panaciterrae]
MLRNFGRFESVGIACSFVIPWNDHRADVGEVTMCSLRAASDFVKSIGLGSSTFKASVSNSGISSAGLRIAEV